MQDGTRYLAACSPSGERPADFFMQYPEQLLPSAPQAQIIVQLLFKPLVHNPTAHSQLPEPSSKSHTIRLNMLDNEWYMKPSSYSPDRVAPTQEKWQQAPLTQRALTTLEYHDTDICRWRIFWRGCTKHALISTYRLHIAPDYFTAISTGLKVCPSSWHICGSP